MINWGTPNTMDALGRRTYEAMMSQASRGGRKNRQRPGNLREQVDPLMCLAYLESIDIVNNRMTSEMAKDYSAKRTTFECETHLLNPEWIEPIMGLEENVTRLQGLWL